MEDLYRDGISQYIITTGRCLPVVMMYLEITALCRSSSTQSSILHFLVLPRHLLSHSNTFEQQSSDGSMSTD